MLGITIIDHTTDKVLMTGGLTKGWSYDAENYLIDRWLFDPLTESFSYIGGPSSYDVAAVYIAQGVADAQQHPCTHTHILYARLPLC